MGNQSQSQDLAQQAQKDGPQRMGAGQGQSQDLAHQRSAQDELDVEAEPTPRQPNSDVPASNIPRGSDTL